MDSTARVFFRALMAIATLLMLLRTLKAMPLANLDDSNLMEDPMEQHLMKVREAESCNLQTIYGWIKEACTSPPMRQKRDTRGPLQRVENLHLLLENEQEDDAVAENALAYDDSAAALRRQKRKALQEHLIDMCCSRPCSPQNFVSWCP